MVVLKNITLTFPLKSSYLIESTTDSTTLQIYLPTITSTTQLGAETTFIKTSGVDQSFFSGSLQPFVIPNYLVKKRNRLLLIRKSSFLELFKRYLHH